MSGQHFFHRRHQGEAGDTVCKDAVSKDIAATAWARRIALAAAAILFVVPGAAQAQSFWNWGPADYSEQRPVRPKPAKVKRKVDPAEKAARNAPKPVGPLLIAVSIEKQRMKVYDSNGLFAEAPVSTGTRSHPTPTGVFSIIQKNKHHVSNLYGAAMPYMQRITWSGVAFHTGPLPGYAASHGCIRLPNEFAARLWVWTRMGTRVVVAPGEISPSDIAHPKLIARTTPLQSLSAAPAATKTLVETPAAAAKLAPRRTADARDAIAGMKGTLSDVDPAPAVKDIISKQDTAPETGTLAAPAAAETPSAPAAAPTEATAAPEAKPTEAAKPDMAAPAVAPEPAPAIATPVRRRGPDHVAVFISRKDQKLYVRQGYEPVFDVPVQIADVERPLGTHVFTARGGKDDQTALQWSVVSLPQVVSRNERKTRQKTKSAAAVQTAIVPALNASEALDRVSIPAEALEKIAAIIAPGGSLLISDHGLSGWETGKGTDFIVPLR